MNLEYRFYNNKVIKNAKQIFSISFSSYISDLITSILITELYEGLCKIPQWGLVVVPTRLTYLYIDGLK